MEVWQKTYHTLNTERLYDKFIVMDDNKAPYYKTSLDDIVHEYAEMSHRSGTIDEVKHDDVSIIVPLYRRIFIDAARAESIFKSLFLENEIAYIFDCYDEPQEQLLFQKFSNFQSRHRL